MLGPCQQGEVPYDGTDYRFQYETASVGQPLCCRLIHVCMDVEQ